MTGIRSKEGVCDGLQATSCDTPNPTGKHRHCALSLCTHDGMARNSRYVALEYMPVFKILAESLVLVAGLCRWHQCRWVGRKGRVGLQGCFLAGNHGGCTGAWSRGGSLHTNLFCCTACISSLLNTFSHYSKYALRAASDL